MTETELQAAAVKMAKPVAKRSPLPNPALSEEAFALRESRNDAYYLRAYRVLHSCLWGSLIACAIAGGVDLQRHSGNILIFLFAAACLGVIVRSLHIAAQPTLTSIRENPTTIVMHARLHTVWATWNLIKDNLMQHGEAPMGLFAHVRNEVQFLNLQADGVDETRLIDLCRLVILTEQFLDAKNRINSRKREVKFEENYWREQTARVETQIVALAAANFSEDSMDGTI